MGCADSCDPARQNAVEPGFKCGIAGGAGGCNNTHTTNDGKTLYTQWLGNSATFSCNGIWEKQGGGSGEGTWQCTVPPVKCDPKQYKIEGYWEYRPDLSTTGGQTKTETKTNSTRSSAGVDVTFSFANSFTEGMSFKPLGIETEETFSFSASYAHSSSKSVSDSTTLKVTTGNSDCPRQAWQWVWKGDHPKTECNLSVRPGNYIAFTNSSVKKPCCLPEQGKCDSNEHNPCKSGPFLCDDFKESDGCTKSCRQLTGDTCTDTERGSCPVMIQ